MSVTIGLEIKNYTMSDFPTQFLIQDTLDEQGLELDGYEGTGMNLFQAEAFRAAILIGNENPFTVSRVSKHIAGTAREVQERFNIHDRTFRSIYRGIRFPEDARVKLSEMDKAHYAATLAQLATVSARPTQLLVLVNAWTASHEGMPPGCARIQRLAKLAENIWNGGIQTVFLNDTAAFMGAFSEDELDAAMDEWGSEPERFAVAIQIGIQDKQSFEEVKGFLSMLPLDLVKSLYPSA